MNRWEEQGRETDEVFTPHSPWQANQTQEIQIGPWKKLTLNVAPSFYYYTRLGSLFMETVCDQARRPLTF